MVLTDTQQSELMANIFYYLSELDTVILNENKNRGIKIVIDLIRDDSINSILVLKSKVLSLINNQNIVVANIIDPNGGISIQEEYESNIFRVPEYIRRELWKIGVDIAQESYSKFVDSTTNEVYVIYAYKNGTKNIMIVKKEIWTTMKKQMEL
jgi:hypothetical protein